MKDLKVVFYVFILGGFLVSSNSCKKITQDKLLNGVWRLDAVNIDSMTENYMNALPHFSDGNGCCAYKFDFQKNGLVLAYYLTYDTFNRITFGSWEVPEADKVTIKVDNFIDGTFDIQPSSAKHWILTSSENHIKAFDGINSELDTTYTKLDINKI